MLTPNASLFLSKSGAHGLVISAAAPSAFDAFDDRCSVVTRVRDSQRVLVGASSFSSRVATKPPAAAIANATAVSIGRMMSPSTKTASTANSRQQHSGTATVASSELGFVPFTHSVYALDPAPVKTLGDS